MILGQSAPPRPLSQEPALIPFRGSFSLVGERETENFLCGETALILGNIVCLPDPLALSLTGTHQLCDRT